MISALGPRLVAPRASRRPGRWPRNWAVFSATGIPASSSTLRAAEVVAIPITRPMPAARHVFPTRTAV